ncbi:MAG: alpha/beta fold hydrolase [Mycobacteriales bacterium]
MGQTRAEAIEGSAGPWPGGPVEACGHALFVRRAPAPGRPPAVFVHGLGGNATNWTDLMTLVADRVDGHALDLPGFGFSAPPPRGRYALREHADAVAAYLDGPLAESDPVHLVGNSLGGAVAILVAARRPERVASLVLLSPAVPNLVPSTFDALLIAAVLPPVVGVVGQHLLARWLPRVRMRAMFRAVYADPSRVSAARLAEAFAEYRRHEADRWADAAFTRSLRGLVATYLPGHPDWLWLASQRVRCPTLLLWGREDHLVSYRLGPALARLIGHATLRVLDGAGHMPELEDPERIAGELRAFLDAPSGGAAPRVPAVPLPA